MTNICKYSFKFINYIAIYFSFRRYIQRLGKINFTEVLNTNENDSLDMFGVPQIKGNIVNIFKMENKLNILLFFDFICFHFI